MTQWRLSGPGSLTQMGPGVVTISASDNFTGGTTVSSGTLALGTQGKLSSSGIVNINSGGVLASNTNSSTLFSNTTSGTLNINNGGSVSMLPSSYVINAIINVASGGTLATNGSIVPPPGTPAP